MSDSPEADMISTTPHQQNLLARFAEALNRRHDHLSVTHSELSAAWPGNPAGKSSLKQLLEVIGEGWSADYRTETGDYVFSRKPSIQDEAAGERARTA